MDRLPSKVVNLPSMEAFKARLDGGCEQPGLEEGVPSYSRGLELDVLEAPSNPTHFVVLLLTAVLSESHSLGSLCAGLAPCRSVPLAREDVLTRPDFIELCGIM